MKDTKSLTTYRFNYVREITDKEPDQSFPSVVNKLDTLTPAQSESEEWIKIMAWMGARGEILEYLDYKLPIPVGYSLENLFEDKSYINLAQAYILGFQRYTFSSYEKYVKCLNGDVNGDKGGLSKSSVDVYRNRWRENSKYLSTIKERYLNKSSGRKSRDEILASDDSTDVFSG